MKRIDLDLRFVTPAFLGGANQGGPAEWRAASVRGQLRWWFRALAGGKLGGDLAKVNLGETAVFGSTEQQGALRLRTGPSPAGALPPSDEPEKSFSIEQGYLGFGPIRERAARRGYLEDGTSVSLKLWWVRQVSEENRALLAEALWCWIHLGGIGGRSRRGFGSLECSDFDGGLEGLADPKALCPCTPAALASQIAALLGEASRLGGSPARWSHLSPASSVWVSRDGAKDWRGAMNAAGRWLSQFRLRYGIKGDKRIVAGRTEADYEWEFFRVSPVEVPDRAGFGLPLAFRHRATPRITESRVIWSKTTGPAEEARRASPLLLHIGKFGDADCRAVLTHLPSLLLPPGRTITLSSPNGAKYSPPMGETRGQREIITHFLDDLLAKKLIEQVWP